MEWDVNKNYLLSLSCFPFKFLPCAYHKKSVWSSSTGGSKDSKQWQRQLRESDRRVTMEMWFTWKVCDKKFQPWVKGIRQDSFWIPHQKNPQKSKCPDKSSQRTFKGKGLFLKTLSGLDASAEIPLTRYKDQVVPCPISVLSLSANGNSNPCLTGVL